MMSVLFDLIPSSDIGTWVVRILAIAGGGAVGGLLVGWVTQVLSRMLTTRPIPRGPLNIVRLLGAIVAGWLVYVLLLPGLGGTGGGGGQGNELGSGRQNGQEQPGATGPSRDTSREDTSHDTSKSETPVGRILRVDVLPRIDAYRAHTPDGPVEYDFKGLTKYLEGELKEKRLAAIEISPGHSEDDTNAVTRLTTWADQHRLKKTVLAPLPKE